MTEELNGKVLAALREATGRSGACSRCGKLIPWFNHIAPQPADCDRCHAYGRLYDKGCRNRGCGRERLIDSGWREQRWP